MHTAWRMISRTVGRTDVTRCRSGSRSQANLVLLRARRDGDGGHGEFQAPELRQRCDDGKERWEHCEGQNEMFQQAQGVPRTEKCLRERGRVVLRARERDGVGAARDGAEDVYVFLVDQEAQHARALNELAELRKRARYLDQVDAEEIVGPPGQTMRRQLLCLVRGGQKEPLERRRRGA